MQSQRHSHKNSSMHRSVSPYLSLLNQIIWQECENFYFPTPKIRQWLQEQGSLSLLMKNYCQSLSVDVLRHDWEDTGWFSAQEQNLLSSPQRCLVRQVLLSGDNTPWVIGHTLIPQLDKSDLSNRLFRLGACSLGDFVFQSEDVQRDALQVAKVDTEDGVLWARRSRLWMARQPMLVTELFLPDAPVYVKENKE
ncbi:chorismate lyase [Vibrio gazogenes]|uniref:Probable chorismate pyruvate-lyase n=2 Tax=Vibrio gazogenes TaxID=687 RepID=A0A1M5BV08_VIBGA|nr:chorismate lyase [Vibrio gazogenes]SHF46359.1 chorismate lyase [Vibrio gazogenes DSM 21264] [Vibrio gazogenes DSM 21264 = NBRC 103151]SJN55699.1 Chorismate pyruvate-lyase [Vibrio gazogenes]